MDLKVNFNQLQDIVDDNIGSGDTITAKLDAVEKLLSDTKHLLKVQKGKTNKDFYDLIDDLSDNVRGISNNYDDLAHGCKRYINKMEIDKYVTNTSIDLMINMDMTRNINDNYTSNHKTALKTISSKIHDLGSNLYDHKYYQLCAQINNSIDNQLENIKTEFNKANRWTNDTASNIHKIMKYHNDEYNELLNLKAKITVGVLVGVGTTALAAFILPASAVFVTVIAVEAGITFAATTIVQTAKNYHDGSDTGESLADGTISGIKAGAVSFGVAGAVGVKKSPKVEGQTINKKISSTLNSKPYMEVNIEAELDKSKLGIGSSQKKYILSAIKSAPKDQASSMAFEEILSLFNEEELLEITNYETIDQEIVIQKYTDYIEEFYAS